MSYFEIFGAIAICSYLKLFEGICSYLQLFGAVQSCLDFFKNFSYYPYFSTFLLILLFLLFPLVLLFLLFLPVKLFLHFLSGTRFQCEIQAFYDVFFLGGGEGSSPSAASVNTKIKHVAIFVRQCQSCTPKNTLAPTQGDRGAGGPLIGTHTSHFIGGSESVKKNIGGPR